MRGFSRGKKKHENTHNDAFFFFHPLRVFSGTQHFRQPFSDINFS